MDFLLKVDLDWLCIAAEIAACLLIFSLAWRPTRASSKVAVSIASAVDWEPLQCAIAHAVTSTGRSLSLRSNALDEQRLRDLVEILPTPYRDRLTGTWNANGMDRLIQEWSSEAETHAYPSCYVLLTLSNVETLMEQRGASCVEAAVRKVSEQLTESLGSCAVISRYQPSRFLLQVFGKTQTECVDSLSSVSQSIAMEGFFSFHEEFISLQTETNSWFCNRCVGPEELIQILEEVVRETPSVPLETSPSGSDVSATEPEVEKPFSIDALAPFPCPWDEEPDPPPAATQSTEPEADPEVAPPAVQGWAEETGIEGNNSQKVEGFASPDQIEELLSQLTGETLPVFGDDSGLPLASEQDEPLENVRPPASGVEVESDSSSRLIDLIDEEEAESEKPAGPPAEMPAPAPELPKSSSIYTDDIEESLLHDDLASLFAAVRSSAVGDFGYSGNKGPQSGRDRAEPKLPERNPGPDPTSS